MLYAVVAVEFAAIVATWRLWDNLNTRPGTPKSFHVYDVMLMQYGSNSLGYRKWMYHKHPRVMDGKLNFYCAFGVL